MRKKYGIFIFILIILLAGFAVTLLNKFYSFDYLYNSIIKRDFAVNPRVEINPEKEYEVRIWHYPFYRMVRDNDEREFFELVKKEVSDTYPNIKLFIGEIDFTAGHKKLLEAVKDGNPPDIYFNITDQNLIDENLQIPVSPYINSTEKEGFYTVNWNKISHRDKLWGWPILVHRQYWAAKTGVGLEKYKSRTFFRKLDYLGENSLLLNYYDETLLRQLLTLVGLDTFKLEKKELDIDSYRALEDVFSLLYKLRQRGIIYKQANEMPAVFLKEFLEGDSVVIGPVNPYLFNFLDKKFNEKNYLLQLDNLIKTYNLNIFRQRKYKGDDHTRAVMEVARIISKRLSPVLADELYMSTAYLPVADNNNTEKGQLNIQEVLEIRPECRKYWDEVVISIWLDFWEKNLTPEEVMDILR